MGNTALEMGIAASHLVSVAVHPHASNLKKVFIFFHVDYLKSLFHHSQLCIFCCFQN